MHDEVHPVAKRPSAVTLTMPQSAYDVIIETLEMDSQSSAFDAGLRRQISKALGQLKLIPKNKITIRK